MMLLLSHSWLCAEGHITDSNMECGCGSHALVSLAKILNRVTAEIPPLPNLSYKLGDELDS